MGSGPACPPWGGLGWCRSLGEEGEARDAVRGSQQDPGIAPSISTPSCLPTPQRPTDTPRCLVPLPALPSATGAPVHPLPEVNLFSLELKKSQYGEITMGTMGTCRTRRVRGVPQAEPSPGGTPAPACPSLVLHSTVSIPGAKSLHPWGSNPPIPGGQTPPPSAPGFIPPHSIQAEPKGRNHFGKGLRDHRVQPLTDHKDALTWACTARWKAPRLKGSMDLPGFLVPSGKTHTRSCRDRDRGDPGPQPGQSCPHPLTPRVFPPQAQVSSRSPATWCWQCGR